MKPEKSGRLSLLVGQKASQGHSFLTTTEAADTLGVSMLAARAAVRRLKAKGVLATPYRGFHVLVPPEYRSLGCLPAGQFVPGLMEHLGLQYYVGLLSAAELHGAAHQRPQVFQVVLAANRPPVRCGRVRVQFVARRNMADVATETFQTPRGYLRASSREVTAVDLVGYARHAGGLSNVATVLAELADDLEGERLVRAARRSPLPWVQRLGFLLEDVAEAAHAVEALAKDVKERAQEYVPLNPRRRTSGARRSKRWRLVINDEVESDL